MTEASLTLPKGVVVKGALAARYDEVLSHDALAFVADLHRRFNETRKRLLALRAERGRAAHMPALYGPGGRPSWPVHGGLRAAPLALSVPALLWLGLVVSLAAGSAAPMALFGPAAVAAAWAVRNSGK